MDETVMRHHVRAMDDDSFLQAFEAAEIPSESWSHDEHLRVCFLYLGSYSFLEATKRLRYGIQKLNAANRVPETLTSGYHETMTIAWARLVRAAVDATPDAQNSLAFLELNPALRKKTLLRQYYSRERIMSETAKTEWVEPDLSKFSSLAGDAA